MKKVLIGAAMLAALASGPAFAAGDAEAGKAASVRCAACHGANGISKMAMYPNLAGQKAKYLVNQMKDFRSGKRSNPMMKAPTANLSDADIDNLAAFYAGL